MDYEGTGFQMPCSCRSLLSFPCKEARSSVTEVDFRKALGQVTKTIRAREEGIFRKKKKCA